MNPSKRPIRSVACVGEVMIELTEGSEGPTRVGVAGDTFNTAVYLARALKRSEVAVSYVTALGDDPKSERILHAMQDHGLATDYVERRAGMTPGLYAIDTDEHGERSFSYARSDSAARTLFSAPGKIGLDTLNTFDIVFLSGISMAILPPDIRAAILAWADTFRAAGGTLIYDSNHRPRLWESAAVARAINTAMWARADIALPSLDDEMDLFCDADEEAVLARLASAGATNGVLKRGAKGPLDLTTRTALADLTPVTQVVDSTAAGDSFNAGFLAAIVLGQSPEQATRAGHELASRVIRAPGAIVNW